MLILTIQDVNMYSYTVRHTTTATAELRVLI